MKVSKNLISDEIKILLTLDNSARTSVQMKRKYRLAYTPDK